MGLVADVIASLGTRIARRPKAAPRGLPPPTYDCGEHGRLTMAQIVAKSGVTKQSIQYRLKQGVRGAALVSPRPARLDCGPMTPVIAIACKLAAQYPDSVPTERQIRKLRPMSKSSSERWRRAWRNALEASA